MLSGRWGHTARWFQRQISLHVYYIQWEYNTLILATWFETWWNIFFYLVSWRWGKELLLAMCSILSVRIVIIFSVCPEVDRWWQPFYYKLHTLFWVFMLFFHFPEIFQVTSTVSDPELSFTIVSCFISPNSNPAVASDYTLIAMVCPKDDSVKFYPQTDAPSHTYLEKKSFTFNFNSKYNLSLLFLHCEMSLCSKMSHANSKLPPVSSVILVFSFIV